MLRRLSLLFFFSFAAACGDAQPGTEDGGPRDAGSHLDAAHDAGPPDAGRDGGEHDAGAETDAALADAGVDAGADAGLDCSTVGCGAPVICGNACTEPCGCCTCADGEEVSMGDTTYVCAGGCYAPRGSGGPGDGCASSAECGAGLSCCYPCGIPGCTNQCEPTCDPHSPGCIDGCFLRP